MFFAHRAGVQSHYVSFLGDLHGLFLSTGFPVEAGQILVVGAVVSQLTQIRGQFGN